MSQESIGSVPRAVLPTQTPPRAFQHTISFQSPDQRTRKHILILILIFIIFLHCNVKPRHLSTIPHRTDSPEELFPDELYMTYPPFSTYEIP